MGGAAAARRVFVLVRLGLSITVSPDSAPAFASAGRCTADGLRQAPAFPIGRAARLGAEARAGDIDGEDLGGVRDDEIADPLSQRGSAARHGVFGGERPLDRAPLGVREADKDTVASRVSNRGSSES